MCWKFHQTEEDLSVCINSPKTNSDKQPYGCCEKWFYKKGCLVQHMLKIHISLNLNKEQGSMVFESRPFVPHTYRLPPRLDPSMLPDWKR